MTRTAWAGTITAHAILIALLAWCAPARVVPDAVTTTVELFAVPPAAAAAAAAAEPAPIRSIPSGSITRRDASVHRTNRGRDRGPAPGPVGAIEAEGGGGGRGGAGDGGGVADGGGLGARAGGPSSSETLPPPKPIAVRPEPPPSKARPARLIWPVRNRAEREGEVFVVHLHVDDAGYVTGVRLVQGVGSRHADAQAEAGVWRFRYAPALDDAGRPIASAFDQKLMID